MLSYTDEEICSLYREAANKRSQIKIIAELNSTSIERIKKVLVAHGYDLKSSPPLDRKRNYTISSKERLIWTPEQVAELIRLHDEKFTNAEIAERMKIRHVAVTNKLVHLHIKANPSRKKVG